MMDKDLFQEYKENPTIEKRNEIVEKYLYMVDILIRKYLGKGVEYDDLYQVGAMALVSAVERFDPDRGFEFSTFATPTILGEIKKYFRDKEWSLKVPRRLKEMSGNINRARERLYNTIHRNPTVEELAAETGYKEEDIIESIESSRAYATYSLDKTFDDSGEEGDSAVLEKFTGFEDAGFDRVEIGEVIKNVLDTFDDDEMLMFRERFLNNRSQTDIADMLGVSQMTISRAEKKMIAKFRKELKG